MNKESINDFLLNSSLKVPDLDSCIDEITGYDFNKYFYLNHPSDYLSERILKQPVIYHYTNFEGVKGIISSESVYIGKIFDMNDNNEMKFTHDKVKDEIIQLVGDQKSIDFFMDMITNTGLNNIYLFSATYNSNSQALGSYGDFSLEFDSEKLNDQFIKKSLGKHRNLKNPKDRDWNWLPLVVNYGYDTNEENIQNIIKGLVILLVLSYKRLDKYKNNDNLKEIMELCSSKLFIISLFLKNPLLYQEEELRLVLIDTNNNGIKPDTKFNGKDKLVIPIGSSLKKIICSKKVDQKAKDEIQSCLDKSKKFKNVEIVDTKLPY